MTSLNCFAGSTIVSKMISHLTIPPSDALRYPGTSILGDENVPNVSIIVHYVYLNIKRKQ